jgi:hypothetical protein
VIQGYSATFEGRANADVVIQAAGSAFDLPSNVHVQPPPRDRKLRV